MKAIHIPNAQADRAPLEMSNCMVRAQEEEAEEEAEQHRMEP